MSYLAAYIPTPDALRIEADLDARAKATSDDRTFEQRRADVFVAQMRGALAGQSISSRAVIGITIPCTSLAGLTGLPGESFDGSFALPAELVRELAADPATGPPSRPTSPPGPLTLAMDAETICSLTDILLQ